jgi:hypothetical protein
MTDLPAGGCIPNIGPAQRRLRLRFGIAMSAVAMLTTAFLVISGAPRPWRLMVFLPGLFAAIGLLQARARTCVALARQGRRNLDSGDEEITDPRELETVRQQARRVNLQAGLAAAAVTAVLVAWP